MQNVYDHVLKSVNSEKNLVWGKHEIAFAY